jgi:carboxypeptidase family protein
MRSGSASRTIGILLAIVLFGIVGLSLNAATNQDKPTYKIMGSEVTLVGTISFIGSPPEPVRIDMSADPICYKVNPHPTTEWVIVANQKLANVVIYVRGEPLNLYSFDAPSPDVTLEHKGCRYVPHVLGMQTQQTLRIVNSDPTTHNTHPTPKNNREWNQSQPPGAVAIEQRFESPELFIPVKDNQHPWEKAYVGVFSHPFFSVSSEDGSYKISGLPPGQYTIVAWHEKFGEQTVDVSLTGNERRNLDFAFKAPN